jgi:hypothetical protein
VAHPQTYGGRNTNALNTSFLLRNEAANVAAKDTDSSSFSLVSGRQQRNAHDTYSSFPFRNEAAEPKGSRQLKRSRQQRQRHRQRESEEQQHY